MQCAADTVSTVWVVLASIASPLGNVDLATGRPGSIFASTFGTLRFRHHPDGRPQPVSDRSLGNNLDTTICDCLAALGIEACTANWIDDGPSRDVAANGAVVPGLTREGSTSFGRGKIEDIVVVELRWGDLGGFGRQSRHDMETFGVHIGILGVICRPFERSRAKSAPLYFVVPCLLVDRPELVVQYQTVVKVRNRLILKKADGSSDQDAQDDG